MNKLRKPVDPEVYKGLGECLMREKHFEKGAIHFTLAQNMMPQRTEYLIRRADAYRMIQNNKASLEILKQALEQKPLHS